MNKIPMGFIMCACHASTSEYEGHSGSSGYFAHRNKNCKGGE